MSGSSSPSGDIIQITAPARLHFGFLDPDGTLGRKFGSVGLAISEPATRLTMRLTDKDAVSGPEADRTKRLRATFQNQFSIDAAFDISIDAAIPAHAGLGSGTQLALAIGAGMHHLTGAQVASDDIGAVAARGARSAIGIAAFDHGGFIIDGGKAASDTPPPVVSVTEFPDNWHIILVFDHGHQGAHGDREIEAFAEVKPMDRATAAHLSHLTVMQMLPALQEANLEAFGAAITELQKITGAYFAPAQGGRLFLSPRVAEMVGRLGDHGAVGLGQSSWGPTGFAFVESAHAAESLYTTLVEDAKSSGLELKIVQGRNSGAQITPIAASRPKTT